MTENVTSVSTNTTYGRYTPRSKWSKIKSIIVYSLLIVLFITVALVIAIIYRGKERFIKQERAERRRLEFEKAGRSVNIQEYPFLAAVFSAKPYLFLCTAAILNERHLLTTANCFTVLFPNVIVRTGSSIWRDGGRLYKVERFIIHEEYDSETFDNNLAIVRTESDIIFNNSTQKCRVSHEIGKLLERDDAVLLGWGHVHKQLIEIGLKKCYTNFCVPSSSVCDRGLTGIVVINKTEVSAMSSFGDIEKDKEMALTAVASYKKWIQGKIVE